MNEHPDWTQEHAVAASYGYCKEDKPKKQYHIAATLKGRAIKVKAGHPIPFFAEDWRIEDESGSRFDNRSFQSHQDAEKMLLQLV